MQCPECGFLNPEGFKFCGQCGAKLAARSEEASRRQLTVVFCDLVGSTTLSTRLDPEELRDVVRRYQAVAVEAVTRYEGHVAQYLGDGILVYFGYPHAHEDDPFRAVMAALELHRGVEQLSDLSVRTGIHTGMVVVGTMGAGGRTEQLALGETPNVAARLQGVAEPGEIVISASTQALVTETVRCTSLGPQALKGLAGPLEAFRVEGERTRTPGPSHLPLVGRESELGRLLEGWNQTRSGLGRCFAVVGPAGIGKSRLLQALKEAVAADGAQVVSLYCSPYGADSALHPVLTQLGQTLASRPPGAFLGAALGLADQPPGATPQSFRRGLFESIKGLWKEMARTCPVLVSLEGADWADPSTLELLLELQHELERQQPIMLVRVAREPFYPPLGEEIALGPLPAPAIAALVQADSELPGHVVQAIVERSDGSPLFAQELARLTRQGRNLDAIPSRLWDLLMARLDALGPERHLVQRGATIGRIFALPLLAAFAGEPEAELLRSLRGLVLEGLLVPSGPESYLFAQELFREVAYQALLRKTRQRYHLEIAELLERRFPDSRPELVARHFSEGGAPDRALGHWKEAGVRALSTSANREAESHFRRALEELPDGPAGAVAEIELQTLLGSALIATRGYAANDVAAAFSRARDLCRELGDPLALFPALSGLWVFYLVRGELVRAAELADRLLELSRGQSAEMRLVALAAVGQTCFYRGEFERAGRALQEVQDLYEPERHRTVSHFLTHPAVASTSYLGWVHWFGGDREPAYQLGERAVRLARDLNHPHTLAHTLFFQLWLAYEEGRLQDAEPLAAELGELSSHHGFALWEGMSRLYQGLLSGASPSELQPVLEGLAATGAHLGGTYFQTVMARLLQAAGAEDVAAGLVQQALATAQERDERWYEDRMKALAAELTG